MLFFFICVVVVVVEKTACGGVHTDILNHLFILQSSRQTVLRLDKIHAVTCRCERHCHRID